MSRFISVMIRMILIIFSAIWLIVITPICGIFPLLLMLHIRLPMDLFFLGLAFLRDLVCIFVIDPEPGTSDVGPPLTKAGTFSMMIVVFFIAICSTSFLIRIVNE